jgi:hypothetical protein
LKIRNRQLLVGVLLLILSVTCFGQNAGQKKEEVAPRGVLKVPVLVNGENGHWQDGRRQDFKIFLDDRETPLKSFQGPKNSTIFLLIFDTVDDLSRVDQARMVLAEKLKVLPPNYLVGILRAQDGLRVLQEPSDDYAKLMTQIQSIEVSGKAGLLDTLQPVSQLASGILSKTGVRVCVLYITDSGIGNYRADYLNPVINASDSGDLSRRFSDRAVQEQVSRITQSLSKFTVPIFILHLSYRADSLNLAYQSGLERIASLGGGQALLCRTVDEIGPGLDAMIERMKATYFLGVDLPVKGRSLVKLRVEAVDPQGASFERLTYPVQLEREKGK